MGTEAKAGPQTDQAQQVIQFVVQQMKAGMDKAAIAGKLQAMGMDVMDSRRVVDSVHGEMMNMAEAQRITSGSLLSGTVGGVLAAVVSGALWAIIVRLTDYEIGFMAWGLGLAVGAGVALFARGRRGRSLQVIAVGASVFGIVIAKYFIFVYFLQQTVLKQFGPESAARVAYFSTKVMQLFLSSLTAMLSPYDALWVLLAVATAWKIPQGLGIRAPKRERGMIT